MTNVCVRVYTWVSLEVGMTSYEQVKESNDEVSIDAHDVWPIQAQCFNHITLLAFYRYHEVWLTMDRIELLHVQAQI
mgnify:CR=1 FL=1